MSSIEKDSCLPNGNTCLMQGNQRSARSEAALAPLRDTLKTLLLKETPQ